ncbi:MAG: epoxyqueuosine reductase QueH [Roseburia sp.]|nr:epoxyqueuosine reductase QueH [Roseburia sp.]
MNRRNYQRELEQKIEKITGEGKVPKLLLHSCCAPCSSYAIEYLSQYFSITVFYYNPNIYPDEEYEKRVEEQKRFIREFPTKYPVDFIRGDFEKERFYEAVRGVESVREGGERCFRCFYLRLKKTAETAKETHADYFATTLSISPLKNADKLNEIGEELSREMGVDYLCSDFKKKNGYKRSVELSNKYGMYRQDYCGCIYSRLEREAQKERR